MKRFSKASTEVHSVLVQAFEVYKESKDLKSYKKVESEVLTGHAETKSTILKLVKSTHGGDKGLSESISNLQVLLDERFTMTTTYQAKMMEFLSKASSGISADAKKEMIKVVDTYEKGLSQIEDKISQAQLKIV